MIIKNLTETLRVLNTKKFMDDKMIKFLFKKDRSRIFASKMKIQNKRCCFFFAIAIKRLKFSYGDREYE
jgi:hypothetical protein